MEIKRGGCAVAPLEGTPWLRDNGEGRMGFTR